ncbi:MFS transporter [Ramlibacter sp. XY19]|uniref:MFS transporter n=1 Tax=Ramlibacter paludis TaxID=2908000 RepID=UPI0023DBA24E|nr:MFS transporter [Ramlibacter paludis]MCG2591307.1 MFS transporter [Ramlibacter paludis]
MKGPHPATLVVLAGISAALHVGKLPPALPALREALGISLVQAGFLLSLVQLAGMTLGLAMGAAADAIGPRRTMVLGLVILSVAGALGGFATSAEAMLLLRAFEGLGFLLASLPGPSLIRRLVEPARLSGRLGSWGTYMPIGTGSALLLGPAVIALGGWPGWWWLTAAASLGMAAWLWRALPAHCDARQAAGGGRHRILRTLTSAGPWLAATTFATYSAQWLAVIGFLPTIYAQAGLPAAWAAAATALAATINLTGNLMAGRLLQRGVPATVLLYCGLGAMALGAVLAFAPWTTSTGIDAVAVRYAGVLLFSAVGGLVPGTLFSVGVRLAPDEGTVSSTVGWMQQWSAIGQFAGPPLAAWLAARSGGWESTWQVTAAFAGAGMVLAACIGRALQRQAHAAAAPAS